MEFLGPSSKVLLVESWSLDLFAPASSPVKKSYGFLQPAQAEMFARQQEMLRKQNLARLEMSAEIIRQKELENLHRQRLLAGDPLSLHPGLPPDHPALRNVHDIPEGHPLREELSRRNAMLGWDLNRCCVAEN
ncbi:sterile alpha motif hypothetical protein [Limosa lapponica baueri]|uniref:Uncharacterized protein n=1 Tax=Limosa lapponica baueri TaxID=1758121 RepID=A0A2I0TB93_LIMLA|nr:sterile alpha motif hypothetical protein [Limosa lapponica baueri]